MNKLDNESKSIRLRFIAITMSAAVVILSIIVFSSYEIGLVRLNNDADTILDVLVENNGTLDEDSLSSSNVIRDNPETPYDTRFIVVRVNKSTGELSSDLSNIGSVTADNAKRLTDEIISVNNDRGTVESFRYKRVDEDNYYVIYILDCRRQISYLIESCETVTLISLISVAFTALIAALSSDKVMKPIIDSHNSQKQFITNAGHDFKTPLSVISADTDILLMDAGDDDKEWLDDIKDQISTLTELTDDLIFLAKADENSATKIQLQLSQIVKDQVDMFNSLLLTKNRTISTDIDDNVIIYGDERSLRQMIRALVDNAIKYSDNGSNISVRLKRKNKNAELTIENLSSNANKDDISHWFDRFYQSADKSRAHGGFGIGLSMVRAVAEAHGGRAKAEYNNNVVRITVDIPIESRRRSR